MTHWPIDRHQLALSLLALLLAFPAICPADIYKCRLPGGKVEISNSPCSGTASTVSSLPDEPVPEARREQAERDLARMRDFVEKREAAVRAEEAAENRRQSEFRDAHARQRVYQSSSLDDCLAELDQHAVDSRRRGELEAICRAKPRPASAPAVVAVPVRAPIQGIGNANSNRCVQQVLQQNLPSHEQKRRLDACQGQGQIPTGVSSGVTTTLPQVTAQPKSGQAAAGRPCPSNDKYCVR